MNVGIHEEALCEKSRKSNIVSVDGTVVQKNARYEQGVAGEWDFVIVAAFVEEMEWFYRKEGFKANLPWTGCFTTKVLI